MNRNHEQLTLDELDEIIDSYVDACKGELYGYRDSIYIPESYHPWALPFKIADDYLEDIFEF